MGEPKDTTIAVNVRLKPSESSAHPRAANYTNVGVAQGTAYLDFGFIEPSLLAAIAKAAKNGQAPPKGLDGHLVTRVAMDVGSLDYSSRYSRYWWGCKQESSRSRRAKIRKVNMKKNRWQFLPMMPLILVASVTCYTATTDASSNYDIINTGIKGSGCWYDDTRFVLLKGHSESSSQTFVVEGMFYVDVSKPRELKPVDLTPLKPAMWQKIYRMRCLKQTILFSAENRSYSLRLGNPPELIAERLNKSIYPEYINYDARYVLSPRARSGTDDTGVSPSQDAALKDCQFSYVKPGYTLHCWYTQLRGLPSLLPRFVFGESYWSDTIRIKGTDGQEKRIANPEPPVNLPDGSELKHGYVLYDLENRVLQQIKLEQPPYQIYHRHLMKVDPQGEHLYGTCSRAGDHGDKHYTEGGRVCRYSLDGNNYEWEEVFAVQQSPKEPFGLQDLDVNGQGDVVVIHRGRRPQSIWKYTVSSRKVEFVTMAPFDLWMPQISPNGRWVSFILRDELHLAHAKGERP